MIKALAEKYSDYIIDRRRWYHANPELSGEEVNEAADAAREKFSSLLLTCLSQM